MRARRTAAAAPSPEAAEQGTRLYYRWLLVSLFLEYARPASFLPFLQIPFLYSAIPLALMMASSFSKAPLRPFSELFSDPMMKLLCGYLAMIAFSVLYATVQEFALNMFIFAVGFTVYALMIARIVTTWQRLYGVVGMLLFAHLFLLAMNPNVILEPETRNYIIGATFMGDGNDFSLSLCLLFPLVMMVAQNIRSVPLKLLCWFSSALVLMALIASQSRGATLGIAAVAFFIWCKSKRKMAAMVVTAFAALGMLMYAPPEYFNRMNTLSSYEQEGSAVGRLMAWSAGVSMALSNPVLGVGAGNFPVAYGSQYKDANNQNVFKAAHSSYFQILGELGFTGLAILVTLIAGSIRQTVRLAKFIEVLGQGPPEDRSKLIARLNMVIAATIGFAVAGTFLSAGYYPHVFILTGLGVATRCLALRDAGIDPLLFRGKSVGRRRGQRGAGKNSSVGVAPADAQPAQKRS